MPKIPEITTKAEERYVSFHQKNVESLEFIRNNLITLGFHPTKITVCGNVSEFRICRKNEIARFYYEIGSWHPEKCDRLRRMVFFPPIWRGSTTRGGGCGSIGFNAGNLTRKDSRMMVSLKGLPDKLRGAAWPSSSWKGYKFKKINQSFILTKAYT